MRWLVGDIQGCARELEELLRAIRFDPPRDQLWCLGDLVNRGPDSLAVLRLCRDAGIRSLLGNHDVNALLAHAGKRRRKGDTLDELFAARDADALLAALREMPILAHLPGLVPEARDVWIVHAGLHPGWTDLATTARTINDADRDDGWLRSAPVSFATRVRCCTEGGGLCDYTGPPEGCPWPSTPWDELYRGETLIVHGHWARRGYYRGPRTMGLDSGCVYGGKLTAWCQEEDRIVQVPGWDG